MKKHFLFSIFIVSILFSESVFADTTPTLIGTVSLGSTITIAWQQGSTAGNPLLDIVVYYGCATGCSNVEQHIAKEVFLKDGQTSLELSGASFHAGQNVWFELFDLKRNLIGMSGHFAIATSPLNPLTTIGISNYTANSSSVDTATSTNKLPAMIFPLKAFCSMKKASDGSNHYSYSTSADGGVPPFVYTWLVSGKPVDSFSEVDISEAHVLSIQVTDGNKNTATAACEDPNPSVPPTTTPTTPTIGQQGGVACANLILSLSQGMTSSNVTLLQNFLVAKGFLSAAPSGYFGVMTKAALMQFQAANGIEATGLAGPLTRAKIKTLSCGI